MRRCLQVCLVLMASACGPDPLDLAPGEGSSETTATADPGSTDTDTSTETDTETETGDAETETGDGCTPGQPSCECLPDETCVDSSSALECVDGLCSECWLMHKVVSPPCSPRECPTDCVIDLEQDALGHVMPIAIPYFSVNYVLGEIPYIEDACEAQDGWIWVVPGEQLTLCGSHCEAWMQPALEGTSYELEYGCPAGP